MKLFGFWRSLATFRVRIALNLKGVPYEEVMIDLLKGNQFEDAYRKVNPQSVVPALDDGEGPALFESLAILEYLDERFPKPALLPEGARARARVRGISQMVACDAHPLIVPRIRKYLATEYQQDDAGVNKWCQHWFNTMSAALERQLADSPATGRYCHGDALTMADLCIVSHVVAWWELPHLTPEGDECFGILPVLSNEPNTNLDPMSESTQVYLLFAEVELTNILPLSKMRT